MRHGALLTHVNVPTMLCCSLAHASCTLAQIDRRSGAASRFGKWAIPARSQHARYRLASADKIYRVHANYPYLSVFVPLQLSV